MTRIIAVIFITALLGGCMVVPLDYGYRDRGYERWNNHHNGGDHSRNWRYEDRR